MQSLITLVRDQDMRRLYYYSARSIVSCVRFELPRLIAKLSELYVALRSPTEVREKPQLRLALIASYSRYLLTPLSTKALHRS